MRYAVLGVMAIGTLTYAVPASALQTFNFTGSIESYTVPTTGVYTITAFGAQGGELGGLGGLGGRTGADVNLTAGQILSILVGGQGSLGGGGGTFVTIGTGSPAIPILVAGGGGFSGDGSTSGDNASGSSFINGGFGGGGGGFGGGGGSSSDGGGGGGGFNGGNGGTSGINFGGDGGTGFINSTFLAGNINSADGVQSGNGLVEIIEPTATPIPFAFSPLPGLIVGGTLSWLKRRNSSQRGAIGHGIKSDTGN